LHFYAAEAAAGDLPNEKVKTCGVCANNGFVHEPIFFEPIKGRVLSDCTNEVKGYRVLNYSNNSQHEHKDLWRDLAPRLWQQRQQQQQQQKTTELKEHGAYQE
jgi:hypothetical protein